MKTRIASGLVYLGIAGILGGSALVGYEDYKFQEYFMSHLSDNNIVQSYQETRLDRAIGYGGCALILSSFASLATGLACLMTDTYKKDKMKWGEEE